jgi:putative tryptophan/tyrosine transport system substrate-binding protein
MAEFRKGLSETGYVEGRNVTVEYRWAHGETGRLSELAAELTSRPVAVIAAPGSIAAALAAKSATATIPIVSASGADPVQLGLVASLNRPGGNITGITSMNSGLGAKQLGLLHQLLGRDGRFAVLLNPSNPQRESVIAEVQAAASSMGQQLEILTATTKRDLGPAFSAAVQKRIDALLISADPLFTNSPVQLATLAARHGMPAIYALREFAQAGGLMSYGSNFAELFRQAGIYTGRILKGEKPADLPILQATKFEFVVNLQTAEALGLEVPATLLALADEVIE